MEVESRWACPTCGERQLALEELPNIGAVGVQPLSDIIGMGDPGIRALPEIVCLHCGRRWPDAASYWAEAGAIPSAESADSADPADSAAAEDANA